MQIVIENGGLKIRGVVSMQSLTRQEFKHFVECCRQPEIRTLDLSEVVRADSACVSLLITALRENASGSLKWVNVPESVKTLAKLYELPNLDEWQQAIA